MCAILASPAYGGGFASIAKTMKPKAITLTPAERALIEHLSFNHLFCLREFNKVRLNKIKDITEEEVQFLESYSNRQLNAIRSLSDNQLEGLDDAIDKEISHYHYLVERFDELEVQILRSIGAARLPVLRGFTPDTIEAYLKQLRREVPRRHTMELD